MGVGECAFFLKLLELFMKCCYLVLQGKTANSNKHSDKHWEEYCKYCKYSGSPKSTVYTVIRTTTLLCLTPF